jgi:AMP phosphorylase
MEISTGGIQVAVINKADASLYDIHPLDRIKIKYGKKNTIAVVNTTNDKNIPSGIIGLFEEPIKKLGLKDGEHINFEVAPKPKSLDYIKKKLDNKPLIYSELKQIINDIVNHRLSDVEMTYFVSACYCNPLSTKETVFLTKAMTEEGQILKVGKPPIVDKHCIGGIPGNRTTMLIVPILASAGLIIPKTSSRSITSPAGTADTVEVLAEVCIDLKKMKEIIRKTNGCMVWGGALNLSPADDNIIQVEKPMSLDSESQLLASIISKKLSVSSTHILIDIPYGPGAKVETYEKAKDVARAFESISKSLKVFIKTITTKACSPIGRGIGPALEARDVLWVLMNDNKQPYDLREKSLNLAGIMLEMGKKAKLGKGKEMAEEILSSGKAYNKFIEILKAQGLKIKDPNKIPLAKKTFTIKAEKNGKIIRIDNKLISKIARVAGTPQNPSSGIFLIKQCQEKVKKGDNLFTIYSDANDRMKYAKEIVKENIIYHIR